MRPWRTSIVAGGAVRMSSGAMPDNDQTKVVQAMCSCPMERSSNNHVYLVSHASDFDASTRHHTPLVSHTSYFDVSTWFDPFKYYCTQPLEIRLHLYFFHVMYYLSSHPFSAISWDPKLLNRDPKIQKFFFVTQQDPKLKSGSKNSKVFFWDRHHHHRTTTRRT